MINIKHFIRKCEPIHLAHASKKAIRILILVLCIGMIGIALQYFISLPVHVFTAPLHKSVDNHEQFSGGTDPIGDNPGDVH